MNVKKVLREVLGVDYKSVKKHITPLNDGQSIPIGKHTITSLYRKTVDGKDVHYIQIDLDGVFVGKIGV